MSSVELWLLAAVITAALAALLLVAATLTNPTRMNYTLPTSAALIAASLSMTALALLLALP